MVNRVKNFCRAENEHRLNLKKRGASFAERGGLLLELLFMVAILMAIFPLMQKDVKRRTDEIRNKAVVRDLTKLKIAVEEYLKHKPTFGKKLVEIDKQTLIDNGLPAGFSMNNILGQEYSVRVKVTTDAQGAQMYDAIILASGAGTDIPPLRIRDIVKDIKGYAGYIENGMIYGPDWQLSTVGWGEGLDSSSIVMRTGFAQKEYKYVSRKPGLGAATMEADLYMSSHDIEGVANLFVLGGIELNEVRVGVDGGKGKSYIDTISVMEKLNLNAPMTIGADLNFPNGLEFLNDNLIDPEVPLVYLEDTLDVGGNMLFTGFDTVNKLRSLDAQSIGGTAMSVANNLMFDGNDGILGLRSLVANSMTVNKNGVSTGLVFSSINSESNRDVSITGNSMDVYDVVVRDVNSALMTAGFKKVGGIDITESTPLSTILRGIFYQYQDIYKLVHNGYDNVILPGWNPNLYKRCEYTSCKSSDWYY